MDKGTKVKMALLALCFVLVAHLEYRDQKFQDEMEEQRIKQARLERDLRYWVPAPTCYDCHTIRKVKGWPVSYVDLLILAALVVLILWIADTA